MKYKNILKGGLLAFLMAMAVIAVADPAIVISKQENLPYGRNIKTRVFLDTTPNNEDNRADAYVDLINTNSYMSMQEFSGMIQAGDIIEYKPDTTLPKDGRYTVIRIGGLLELNGRNIYEIFVEDFEDPVGGYVFYYAQEAYKARQGRRQSNAGGRSGGTSMASLPPALPALIFGKREREI